MRVLSVGNMYPPHHLGGYELTWRSAVEHERASGHRVRVLTTDYRRPDAEAAADEDVRRELRWYWRDHSFPPMGLAERLALERHNARTLDRHLRDHSADVVSWWAMGGMSLSLIEQVRRAGVPAVGMVGDEWMVYGPRVDGWSRAFRRRPGLARVVERATGVPCRLDLGSAAVWLFNSELTRRSAMEAGWVLPRTAVVHPGIDRRLFRPAPPSPWRGRLLCLGRIDPRKGVHLAIDALVRLTGAELRVVGEGDEGYMRELRALAQRDSVAGRVSFDRVPREQVPQVYGDSDAVVFPVQWEEPWGLVPLEAMAVGTPVVATGTGGSGEYLRHEENCLIFAPRDDPGALASAVSRLARDPELRLRLREGGLATAARFDEAAFNEAVREAIEDAAAATAEQLGRS